MGPCFSPGRMNEDTSVVMYSCLIVKGRDINRGRNSLGLKLAAFSFFTGKVDDLS